MTGLPLLFTSVRENLATVFEGQSVLPLRLQKKII
jgi:hypothetical protein